MVAILHRVNTEGNPTLNLLLWIFKNNSHDIKFTTIRFQIVIFQLMLHFLWCYIFYLSKCTIIRKLCIKWNLSKNFSNLYLPSFMLPHWISKALSKRRGTMRLMPRKKLLLMTTILLTSCWWLISWNSHDNIGAGAVQTSKRVYKVVIGL